MSDLANAAVMHQADSIFVAGHRGLVGSAILRRLRELGFDNLLIRSHAELDLADKEATREFFESRRPQFVFLAAAKVGGIYANTTWPADFIRDNLAVQTSVFEAAHATGVRKLLFLGSSCVYPARAQQPIREDALLSGPLEPTNEAYAIAKIAGILMCRSYNRQFGTRFMSIMPTNLYGPHDNFDLDASHVLPGLLHRFHLAKTRHDSHVVVWGSGNPRREFLHVDDMADASIQLMQRWAEQDVNGRVLGGADAINEIVNVGFGEDVPIGELAHMIRETVQYDGSIVFDRSKPDGTLRKLLDSSRLRSTGWYPRIPLASGIARTYEWFLAHRAEDYRGVAQ
jgi:GDP-L-fucose synthase